MYTVGHDGMHRCNNQDHSMLTAMLAARNLMGGRHDLRNVNVELSCHEEFMARSIEGERALDAVTDAAAAMAETDTRPRELEIGT